MCNKNHERKQNFAGELFELVNDATKKEELSKQCVKSIAEKSLSLSITEEKTFQEFKGLNAIICMKIMQNVILTEAETAEKHVLAQMRKAECGSTLQNRQIKSSMCCLVFLPVLHMMSKQSQTNKSIALK